MARFRPLPLHVVDGSTRGPDGEMLSPFARFVDRFTARRPLDAPGQDTKAAQDGAAVSVSSNAGADAYLVAEDGSVTVLELVEVENVRS